MKISSIKWVSFFGVLVVILGLSLQKVFSLSESSNALRDSLKSVDTNLLLTTNDGLLSDPEAWSVYSGLNTFISKTHFVGKNEWLEKIANKLNISPLSIRSTNNLEDPQLRPSQEIILQNKNGMVHVARENETLASVIKNYERLGSKKEKIFAANSLSEITYLKEGQLYLKEGEKLWVPDARRSFPFLVRPVNWSRISSRYGLRRHPMLKTKRWHDGYDLVAPHGAPVYAGQKGVVVFAGWNGGYGNVIEIRHSKITTRYGHLSKLYVQSGQFVSRKQIIGRVGSTGLSTGPHLHFEVRRNSDGHSVRPGKYLN